MYSSIILKCDQNEIKTQYEKNINCTRITSTKIICIVATSLLNYIHITPIISIRFSLMHSSHMKIVFASDNNCLWGVLFILQKFDILYF